MRDQRFGCTIFTSVAGEYYVAYRLSIMGCLVALTRGEWPTGSLLVGDLAGHAAISLQVRTSMDAFRGRGNSLKTNHWQWPLKEEDLKRGSVSDKQLRLRRHEGSEPVWTPRSSSRCLHCPGNGRLREIIRSCLP